jgi:hypothetical protein
MNNIFLCDYTINAKRGQIPPTSLRCVRQEAGRRGEKHLSTQPGCALNATTLCDLPAAAQEANSASTPATSAGLRRPAIKIPVLFLFLVLFFELLPLVFA